MGFVSAYVVFCFILRCRFPQAQWFGPILRRRFVVFANWWDPLGKDSTVILSEQFHTDTWHVNIIWTADAPNFQYHHWMHMPLFIG